MRRVPDARHADRPPVQTDWAIGVPVVLLVPAIGLLVWVIALAHTV